MAERQAPGCLVDLHPDRHQPGRLRPAAEIRARRPGRRTGRDLGGRMGNRPYAVPGHRRTGRELRRRDGLDAVRLHEVGHATRGQVTLEQYRTLHEAGLAQPIVQYIRDYVDTDKLKG